MKQTKSSRRRKRACWRRQCASDSSTLGIVPAHGIHGASSACEAPIASLTRAAVAARAARAGRGARSRCARARRSGSVPSRASGGRRRARSRRPRRRAARRPARPPAARGRAGSSRTARRSRRAAARPPRRRRATRAGRRARRASRRAARPGPAGIRISQRIVLVIRPSSGAGVTAWRRARKLMKMKTAPVENIISISANAATPQALAGATASISQPAPQTAKPSSRHGPGPMRRLMRLPNTLASTVPTPMPVKLRPIACSERPRVRVANRIWTTVAAWWHACQQPTAIASATSRRWRATKRTPCLRSSQNWRAGRAARRAARARGSSIAMPRRIAAETVTITASTSSASGAPTSLISAPARPGPATSAPERGERVLGVRLDQPVARDDLGEDDLRRAAGDRVDRADDEAADVEPVDREPAGPPGERHARDDDADRQLAGDVDGQLSHPIEPDADRQREQHERQQLHRRQQAHLRRAGVQQHGRPSSGSASIVTWPPNELIRIDVHRRR